MNSAKTLKSKERHYPVDEAGDPTLFNRYEKVIVDQKWCSN